MTQTILLNKLSRNSLTIMHFFKIIFNINNIFVMYQSITSAFEAISLRHLRIATRNALFVRNALF